MLLFRVLLIGLLWNQAVSLSPSSQTIAKKKDVFLFSLLWPQENLFFSKSVKDVWRWKDAVLGDGRDFFVPKPKTLSALNRYLVTQSPISLLSECCVLSNCARFEIIVLTENPDPTSIQISISQSLANQIQAYQDRPFAILQDQLSRFDTASLIDFNAPVCRDEVAVKDIVSHWNLISGEESVCRHLCLVAAGMAPRPSRPDRPVPFRPFSSRDAHILLQLKRTRQLCTGGRLGLILDAALSAGKACRTIEKVPELLPLKHYGTGDSKYNMEPPIALVQAATEAAVNKAIDPAVAGCIKRWNAMLKADSIARLFRETEKLVRSERENKWLRKRLHQPIVEMRSGKEVDVDHLIKELEGDLEQLRIVS